MQTGKGKIPGNGRRLIQAEFASEFLATATIKGKPVRILGPNSVSDRRLRCVVNPLETVVIDTDGIWTFHVEQLDAKEKNSGRPVELGIPEERPLSLREEMQRYVRDILSAQQESEGQETFEESNDFDVPDDEPGWHSQYEVLDMPEDDLEPLGTPDPKADSEPEGEAVEKESAEPAEDAGQAKEQVA